MTRPAAASPLPADPLQEFSQCHAGILGGLRNLGELPALALAARQAQQSARATLDLFDHAVLTHHADEEAELFPAVIRSALPGPERHHVEVMVELLIAEHRLIESHWKQLRPAVKKLAQGAAADLDSQDVAVLVAAYAAHAASEETGFLPLSQQILGRDGNHMAALGLSLHLRHTPLPTGYI
jgi:hypothetical protein